MWSVCESGFHSFIYKIYFFFPQKEQLDEDSLHFYQKYNCYYIAIIAISNFQSLN